MNISNLLANVSSTAVSASPSAILVGRAPSAGVEDFTGLKFEATLDFEMEQNLPQESAVEAEAEAEAEVDVEAEVESELKRRNLSVPVMLAEIKAPVLGAAVAHPEQFGSVSQSSEARSGELSQLADRSLRSQATAGLTAVEFENANLASRATTVLSGAARLAEEGGAPSSSLISSSLKRGLSDAEVSPTKRSHASPSISNLSQSSAAAPHQALAAAVPTARIADLNLVQGRGLSLRQTAQAVRGPERPGERVVSEFAPVDLVERSLGHPHTRTAVQLASTAAGFQQAGQQFSNRSSEERDPREAAAKKAHARAIDAVVDASGSSSSVAAKGAAAPVAASVTGGQVMQRLIESIEVLAQQTRRKEISFSLDLERGKQLQVNLRIVGGHVRSIFVTDSDSLRQAIRDNWEQLQRQISAQGLQAEAPDFGDALSGGQFEQSEQQEQREQQKMQADQLRSKALAEVKTPVVSRPSPSIVSADTNVVRYA